MAGVLALVAVLVTVLVVVFTGVLALAVVLVAGLAPGFLALAAVLALRDVVCVLALVGEAARATGAAMRVVARARAATRYLRDMRMLRIRRESGPAVTCRRSPVMRRSYRTI